MGFITNLLARLFKAIPVNKASKKLGMGLIPSPKDPRDFRLGIVDIPLPEECILRNYKVKMQGNYNSCTGHAVSSSMEIISDSDQLILSPRYNWYHSRKDYMGNFPRNEGVYLRDALKSAQKLGVTAEALCPYVYSDLNKDPTLFAESFARFFKIGSYYGIFGETEIKYSITRGMPVVIGMMVWPEFMNNRDYILKSPSNTFIGAHAMVIIGYTKEGFILLNSYGNGWGTGGIAILPYSIASNYNILFESWAVSTTTRG